MIEYVSKPGGRHLYSEDMINLQNMVLAFTELFKNCGRPFVISGCNIITEDDVTYIGEGYVWLGGKVRYVPKTTYDSAKNNYIIPNDVLSDPIIYATPGISGPIYRDCGVRFVHLLPDGYDGDFISLFHYSTKIIENYNLTEIFYSFYSITKSLPQNLNKPVDFLEVIGNYIRVGYLSRQFRFYRDLKINSSRELEVFDYTDDFGLKISFEDLLFKVHNYGNEEFKVGENLSNTQIILPTVNTKDITSSSVSAKSMSINNVPLDVILRPKTPLSNWLPLSGTSNLVVRQVGSDVYITGRLPFADESAIVKATEQISDDIIKKQTSIKLPSSISAPPENTVFVVRGGNHCYYNGSARLYFDSDGYLCIELDSREQFIPNPSSVFWHYIVD